MAALADLSRMGFVAYGSAPAEVGQTIESALKQLREVHGHTGLRSWVQNDIPGRFLVDPIFQQIRNSPSLVADITTLNFNVVFEIGFGIGARRRVVLIRHGSLVADESLLRSVGVFDTLGYKRYNNSNELALFLRSITDVTPLAFEDTAINRSQPLFLLLPRDKTDTEIRLVSRIKKAGLRFRQHDPQELGRLAAGLAIDGVAASVGVVVPLLPSNRQEAQVHNIRAAFVAGLALGMNKNLLFLQAGHEPVPLDYRDLVQSYSTHESLDLHIADFVPAVFEAALANPVVPLRARTDRLSRVSLGASAAENEFDSLPSYFLPTAEYQRVRRGEIQVVAGRKGSGKTALFGELRTELRRNKNVIVLDLRPEGFRLLKFKELILDSVKEGTKSHLMTAFWEYLLLLETCHKLLDKDKQRHLVDHVLFEPYQRLEREYRSDVYVAEGDFAERMSRLLDRIASDFAARNPSGSNPTALTQDEITGLLYKHDIRNLHARTIEYLEKKQGLWILFDNLDKGWPPHGVTPEDLLSFRALLDAMGKIRTSLKRHDISCVGVVFVRNDIYELLVEGSADRGKVARALIDWTDPQLLREVLRRRMRVEGDADDVTFETLWNAVCVSHIHGEESSQYLINRSLMRPRCLIDLVQECRSHALNLGRHRIDADDVRFGEQRYSTELTNNVSLEIADVLPSAGELLYHMIARSARLPSSQLAAAMQECGVPPSDQPRAIELLLWYGVLGFPRPAADPAYIYSVNYDLRRLKAIGSQVGTGELVYSINEAFHAGLEIQT